MHLFFQNAWLCTLGQALGGPTKILSLPKGGAKTHNTHLQICILDTEFHNKNGLTDRNSIPTFQRRKIQVPRKINAMLVVLSGRDGTRIWTFIFSVTIRSQETMYCISFLHFNVNSQYLIEEVRITFMIRKKILVKEKYII